MTAIIAIGPAPKRDSGSRVDAAVVEDEQEQEHAREPGPGRPPAEEIEGAGHHLGVDLLLGLSVHRALEGPVDEVEEVQHPDPDDAREDVDPAGKCAQEIHGGLLVSGCAGAERRRAKTSTAGAG